MPRFRILPLMIIVASIAIGLGIVINLDRLHGQRRQKAYVATLTIIALAWYGAHTMASRAREETPDPPEPE